MRSRGRITFRISPAAPLLHSALSGLGLTQAAYKNDGERERAVRRIIANGTRETCRLPPLFLFLGGCARELMKNLSRREEIMSRGRGAGIIKMRTREEKKGERGVGVFLVGVICVFVGKVRR